MPAVPSVPIFGPSIIPDTVLNQLADAVRFAMAPPLFVARQTVAQALTNGVYDEINWDSVTVDTVNGHDSGLPTRYTAQYAGWYQLSGGASFAANATGIRRCGWAINGSAIDDRLAVVTAVASGGLHGVARTMHVYLSEEDYVELWALQGSGGSLNTDVANGVQSSISVRWVSN